MKVEVPVPAANSDFASGDPLILDGVRAEMLDEYRQNHSYPWAVAYSGGKDSTNGIH